MRTILEFKNIKKDFESGDQIIEAVKPINLKIKQNEFVAIIGPSGSGKSTLLTLAGLLQKPSDGEILIDGENVLNLKDTALSDFRLHKIGFILQASNLVPFLSVEKQLKFLDKMLKRKPDNKKIDSILDDLGILSLKKKLPADISGGERQRVAIARVMYAEPAMILADEPTASLDSERSYQVMDILKDISRKQNCGVIVVTHDLRMIGQCDRVFEMVDGLLTEKELEAVMA